MAWRWWQQHKADRAEARSVGLYLKRRAAYRSLCETVEAVQRSADAHLRLENVLSHLPGVHTRVN